MGAIANGGNLGFTHLVQGKGYVEIKHKGIVHSLSFDSVGRRLVSGCSDGVLRMIDPRGGELENSISFSGKVKGSNTVIYSVSFDPNDSRLVAAGSRDGKIRIVNVTSSKIEREIEHAAVVHSTHFDCRGRSVAAGCGSQLRIIELAAGFLEHTIDQPTGHVPVRAERV